ncbi:MAG TPA: hypothetical protein VHK01_17605, partial [Lacipirellulaceae bacterium]|nr:hypothetical protein [Lacipirellulaceae bacterium]
AQRQNAEALYRFTEAQSHAEDAFNAFTAAYHVGNATYDVVVTAAKNLTDIKRKIIQLEQQRTALSRAAATAAGSAVSTAPPEADNVEKPPATSAAPDPKQPSSPNKRGDTGVTVSAESQEALDQFMRLASSTPRSGESIGVLKRIVQREKQKYDRMAELAKTKQISAIEVETQKADYEISMERLRQAERALEYYQAEVAMAAAEYEAVLDASKKAPGAVTELELRKLQLKVQLAEAKYKELAE